MIITVAIVLSSLVALNFFLLIFSCNKNTKSKEQLAKPTLSKLKKQRLPSETITSTQLAPTGS